MAWPRDDAKLDRVRARMAERGPRRARRPHARQRPLPLELLVHEGLRHRRLPPRGRAGADRRRAAGGRRRSHRWTSDIRLFRGLRPGRPAARRSARSTSPSTCSASGGSTRIGLELSHGTQTADRMLGEPTVFTQAFFEAFGTASTPRRSSPRPARSRPSRRSSGCDSRTSWPRRRWSTSASGSSRA